MTLYNSFGKRYYGSVWYEKYRCTRSSLRDDLFFKRNGYSPSLIREIRARHFDAYSENALVKKGVL